MATRAARFVKELKRAYPIRLQSSGACLLLASLVKCANATDKAKEVVLPSPHNFFFAMDYLVTKSYARFISVRELEDNEAALVEVQSWLCLFHTQIRRYNNAEFEAVLCDDWKPGWGAPLLENVYAVAAMDHCAGLLMDYALATLPDIRHLAAPVASPLPPE